MKQIILDLSKPVQKIEISEDTEILGLFVGKKDAQIKTVLEVIHKKPHLNSLTMIKAVAYDNARFDMEGKLVIKKGAKYTDSYLKIDVLLMSENSWARAVPSLEITEDDVKGGHGATVGQVDKEQLFYLQSRGIEAKTAEEVLVEGFVQELLQKVKLKSDLKKLLGD